MNGKTRLDGCQMMPISKAFNGGDGAPLDVSCERHARKAGLAVNEHRTASTGTKIAPTLDAELTHIVAENIEQDRIAWCQHLNRAVVDLGLPNGLRCLRQHWDPCFADHLRTGPWSCLHPLRIGLMRYDSSSLLTRVRRRCSSNSIAFRSTSPWCTRMVRLRMSWLICASSSLRLSKSLHA